MSSFNRFSYNLISSISIYYIIHLKRINVTEVARFSYTGYTVVVHGQSVINDKSLYICLSIIIFSNIILLITSTSNILDHFLFGYTWTQISRFFFIPVPDWFYVLCDFFTTHNMYKSEKYLYPFKLHTILCEFLNILSF